MSARREPILPGATLGMLGSGQLGRMFALAARRLGYRIHVLSNERDSPTGQIADREIVAPYDDVDAVRSLASQVAVVTFEFENVASACAEAADAIVPCRPGVHILHLTQHRLREKDFLTRIGVPTPRYARATTLAEVAAVLAADLAPPVVMKTASSGYDGKGQALIRAAGDASGAWKSVGGSADGAALEVILEEWVTFEREVSVIVARSAGGEVALYGPVHNDHANHILDVSVCPADVPPAVQRDAHAIARTIAEALDLVGVLCVEMFLTTGGRLMVNELAPRPHNSGHLTIEACITSQFEQQVRTICGLPPGDPTHIRPAAMANLLGEVWSGGEPRWDALADMRDVKLHLYGKSTPRRGRKMGHVTALADSPAVARTRVIAARAALVPPT